MGRVWVLDTDTKGTGAEMVPLDTLLERKRSASEADPEKARRRKPRTRRQDDVRRDSHEDSRAAEASRARREFRLVNALSGQLIGERVDLRGACEVLAAARSVADVRVYVRERPDAPWRALTLREQRALRAQRQG